MASGDVKTDDVGFDPQISLLALIRPPYSYT